MNNFSNIAVIGAGIVGASIAFHLARRGAKVTLIDGGCTWEEVSDSAGDCCVLCMDECTR